MEKLFNKENVNRVQKIIKKFDPLMEVIILKKTAKTALEASEALGCKSGAIIKSLIIKVSDRFLLCLIAGDKKCSFNKLKIILNTKNLSMASAKEVKSQTGFSIGGVSPVAHINNLNIFIDQSLDRFGDLFAAAGHPNCIFKINYKDLIKITNGYVKDISE